MSRRFSAAALVAGVLALVIALTASAAAPDHFTDSQDYSGVTQCEGFNDVWVGHLDVHGITKYDRQGNPVEDIVHVSGWETNSRSDDPSISITAKRNFDIVFTYADGLERDNGNVYTQVAKGQGVLFHDVGNIVFDGPTTVAVHGPHDANTGGDAVFCAALEAVS